MGVTLLFNKCFNLSFPWISHMGGSHHIALLYNVCEYSSIELSIHSTTEQFAQRKHWHFLDVIRSLLLQANASLKLWGDVILTAGYLINLKPYFVLNNQTPPSISILVNLHINFLCVFGCICFVFYLCYFSRKRLVFMKLFDFFYLLWISVISWSNIFTFTTLASISTGSSSL